MTSPAQYLERLGFNAQPADLDFFSGKTYVIPLWYDDKMASIATQLDYALSSSLGLGIIYRLFLTAVLKLHLTEASYDWASKELAPIGKAVMEEFYEAHKSNCERSNEINSIYYTTVG